MLTEEAIRELLTQAANAPNNQAARAALVELDEEGVEALTSAFYAGVSEAVGDVLIEVVGEIGGPDALSLLRYIYHFEEKHPSWQQAAKHGLLRNRDNLDQKEIVDLLRGL